MSDAYQYNGPGKAAYFDALGKQIEYHFQQMRAMAWQAANMADWERQGGEKADLKDGMIYAKLSPEERIREAQRNMRVWSWYDMVESDDTGQYGFGTVLDKLAKEPPPDTHRFPLGSRASTALARTDGYTSGRGGHLNLADNPWPDDTMEAGSWAEGFGLGMEDRPPAKPEKPKKEPKAKANGKSALDEMSERAANMDKPGWDPNRDFTDETGPVE